MIKNICTVSKYFKISLKLWLAYVNMNLFVTYLHFINFLKFNHCSQIILLNYWKLGKVCKCFIFDFVQFQSFVLYKVNYSLQILSYFFMHEHTFSQFNSNKTMCLVKWNNMQRVHQVCFKTTLFSYSLKRPTKHVLFTILVRNIVAYNITKLNS